MILLHGISSFKLTAKVKPVIDTQKIKKKIKANDYKNDHRAKEASKNGRQGQNI